METISMNVPTIRDAHPHSHQHQSTKFRQINMTRTLSKDKAACEFYQDHLAEGDLPSLSGTPRNGNGNGNVNANDAMNTSMATPIPYTKPSAIHSPDNDLDPSPQMNSRIVSPSPSPKRAGRKPRSMTPKFNNKSDRNVNTKATKAANTSRGRGLMKRKKDKDVTITAPRLSPESKRKHKVFWSQMDLDNDTLSSDHSGSDGEDQNYQNRNRNNTAAIKPRSLMPNNNDMDIPDEMFKSKPRSSPTVASSITSNNHGTSRGRSIHREVETVGEDEETTNTHSIISILTEMCCGPDALEGGKNVKPDYKRPSTIVVRTPPRKSKTRGIPMYSNDNDNGTSGGSSNDDDDNATFSSKTTVSRNHVSDYYMDSLENTAIEVEYYDAGVPDDEIDPKERSVDKERELSPQSASGNGAMSSSFLQLNTSGDVTSFVRDERKARSDVGVGGMSPSVSERGGYIMSKSQSWSMPDKSAYLQAMAKKAKEEFRQKKSARKLETSIEEPEEVDDDGMNDSVDEILGDITQASWKSSVTNDDHNMTTISDPLGKRPSGQSGAAWKTRSYDGMPMPSPKIPTSASTLRAPTGSGESTTQLERRHKNELELDRELAPFQRSKSYDFEDLSTPHSVNTFHTRETDVSDFLSPTGVAEFPEHSSDTGVGMKRQQQHQSRRSPVRFQKVQSDISHKKKFLSGLRSKSANRNLGGSPARSTASASSKRSGADGPYKLSSTSSLLSFRKKKRAKDGTYSQMEDKEFSDDDDYDDNNTSTQSRSISMYDINPINPEAGSPPKPTRNEDDIFDFDDDGEDKKVNENTPLSEVQLDPKKDSSDVSMLGGSIIGLGDGSTVFSSNRSIYTTGTNATNWSTSTRRRHRGAAKHRVTEEDTQDRPSGWLESIRAAAQQNNRRWDPKIGWVDYVDPDDQKELKPSRFSSPGKIGRLKPPVLKRLGEEDESDNVSVSTRSIGQTVSSIPPPPPPKWERNQYHSSKDDDGAASAITEVVSNQLRSKAQEVQQQTNMSEYEVDDIAEEESQEEEQEEDEFDYDNKSDGQKSSPERNSRSFAGATEGVSEESVGGFDFKSLHNVPEKGKLFTWIGAAVEESAKDVKQSPTDEENIQEVPADAEWSDGGNDDASEQPPIHEDCKQEASNAESKTMIPPETSRRFRHLEAVKLKNVIETPFFEEIVENRIDTKDTDGDDFEQNDSFDFTNNDSAKGSTDENSAEDGFMVIEESKGRKFDPKELEPRNVDVEVTDDESYHGESPEQPYDDGSAFAVEKSSVISAGSVSSKAKEWMNRVELERKKSLPKRAKSRDSLAESAIFVSAVDDNSTFDPNRMKEIDEDNSVFNFDEEPQNAKKRYVRKQAEKAAPPYMKRTERATLIDHNETMSEITPPSSHDGSSTYEGSFLSRLQACASPVFEKDMEDGVPRSMPQAHLAFLRNSAKKESESSGLMDMLKSRAFCGTTSNVDDSSTKNGLPPRTPSAVSSAKGKSPIASSYLQAIKDKTGSPSGWGKGTEPKNLTKVESTASTSSSHSESWQKFLEKRNKALASTSAKRSNASSSSKSAEEYANAKVNEVISKISAEGGSPNKMAENLPCDDTPISGTAKNADTNFLRPPSRNSSIPRSKASGRARPKLSNSGQQLSKNDAAKAAEDLAAARVEAMMAMMASTAFEGEI